MVVISIAMRWGIYALRACIMFLLVFYISVHGVLDALGVYVLRRKKERRGRWGLGDGG